MTKQNQLQRFSSLKNNWRSLGLFMALIILIQALGSWTTFTSVQSWYATLRQPPWSPPNWLFGPVWTILYAMLAIAGWLLWVRIRHDKPNRPVIFCYFAQLFFNALWSPLFFGLRQPLAAFIDIVLLVVFALLTLYFSAKTKQRAVAWMFVPYCLWVLYASSLNGAIVVLN